MNLKKIPLLLFSSLVFNFTSYASTLTRSEEGSIPDEYENGWGQAVGVDNAGVAAIGGISSVQINPSLLAIEKQYTVAGGYTWPTEGRDFFQAGIVDSKTSNIAAGFSYRGFMDDYKMPQSPLLDNDAPIKRRAHLGLAQDFKALALGIQGSYVEGYQDPLEEGVSTEDDKKLEVKRGTTLGLGATGLLTPQLRVAGSVENLANKKVQDLAPRTFRLGVAYLIAGGNLSFHLDYRQRERVSRFEGPIPEIPLESGLAQEQREKWRLQREEASQKMRQEEQLTTISMSTKLQDFLRFLAAYTHGLSDQKRSAAAGFAVVNEKFVLSYALRRPFLEEAKLLQTVTLAVGLSL